MSVALGACSQGVSGNLEPGAVTNMGLLKEYSSDFVGLCQMFQDVNFCPCQTFDGHMCQFSRAHHEEVVNMSPEV